MLEQRFTISIVEPFHHGHHLTYVRHIIDSACLAIEPSRLKIKLHLTPEGLQSPDYQAFIAPVKENTDTTLTIAPLPKGRLKIFKGICRRVDQVIEAAKPEMLIYPSADFATPALGLSRLLRLRSYSQVPNRECMMTQIGLGYPASQRFALDFLDRIGLKCAPWTSIGLVDVVAYEFLRNHHPKLSKRLRLIPDPVQTYNSEQSKKEARRALELEENRFWFVCPGIIRVGKGIDRLLSAFALLQERVGSSDLGLALIGPVRQNVKDLFSTDQRFARGLEQGQIVMIDRMLSGPKFGEAIRAGDVTCCTYPAQNHPSSVAVTSLAYQRPVLCSDRYWMGEMGEKFKMGWVSSVDNIDELADTMQRCIDEAAHWQPTSAAERLVRYQSAENFRATWQDRFNKILHQNRAPVAMTWDQVNSDSTQSLESC